MQSLHPSRALKLKWQLHFTLGVLSRVKASVGIANQASCLEAAQPHMFLIVLLLIFAHVNDSVGSIVESSSIKLLSKAGCLLAFANFCSSQ